MLPILKVQKVCKAFGGVIAAQNVNFELQSSEIMGLIGPNGAGKTTMLNLISGILSCDSGQVFLEDADVTKIPAHKRTRMGLARTFQQPRFLQKSSIRDNLLLGTDLADKMGYLASFFGRKGIDFEKELGEYMELSGFSIKWEDDISAIPYGQRKMLELIRAMLSHPKVLLIDEPAAGLNAAEIEKTVDMINYCVSKNIGVILIEHKMDMVMNLCHKIVVLNFGKVIASGSPEEIKNNEEVLEAYLGRNYNAANQ